VGVLNNLKSILPIVHAHPNQPLVCVDAVSSLGGVDLPMDNLGIDVLFTGSQKCWMAPPGICMLSVSKKAWEFHKSAKNPRYYFDLDFFKKFDEKNQTPSTPALATLFGLDASLSHMAEVGRDAVFSHHQTLMHHTRNKIKKMGMKLFVADEDASPTVTSIALPVGNDGSGWLKELRETHHVVLAGGMGEAKGKILRIAHMGYAVKKEEIDQALEALEKVASRKE
jgi:aspartate aminotransferase-like enzyme